MSRTFDHTEYVLRVNLKNGLDVRRFCEVRVKGKDVYIYQPSKGQSVKVSYHESGQEHVKVGQSSPIIPPMHLDPVAAIVTEEKPWSKSFENFADLLPYKGEPANDVFEIELPPLPYVDTISFAQIAIGRAFDTSGMVCRRCRSDHPDTEGISRPALKGWTACVCPSTAATIVFSGCCRRSNYLNSASSAGDRLWHRKQA